MQRTRLAEAMLSNDPAHPFALEADPKVKARNRYVNVQAWANSRIHLRVPEGECDFINASPITLKDSVTQEERNYIATQACLTNPLAFLSLVLGVGNFSTNSFLSVGRDPSSAISLTFGIWSSMKPRMWRSLSC